MSTLEPLAPDQRAVVSLVLRQGRSYDEIAALLGHPAEAVRDRAHAGLAALAHDNGLPAEVTGRSRTTCWGSSATRDAAATRGAARRVGAARTAPGRPCPRRASLGAPRSPPTRAAQSSRPPAQRPDPPPAPSSRLGGALLIAGVLAAVAVVLYLVLSSGGGDDPGRGAGFDRDRSEQQPRRRLPTPAAQVADTIPLRSPAGSDAKGTMTVYLQEGQLLFALEAPGRAAEQRGGGSTASGSPVRATRRAGSGSPTPSVRTGSSVSRGRAKTISTASPSST